MNKNPRSVEASTDVNDESRHENHNHAQHRVAVIGGGPGGLAAAARLVEAGVSVELFEASQELGGLARSLSLWGRQVELSAHIFRSRDDFVNRLWRDGADEQKEISLRRGIFDGQGVIEYPITPRRILKRLGPVDTVRSVFGLAIGRASQLWLPQPDTAEDWMVRNYGRALHEKFLRDYAEKLWGVSCSEISSRFPQFLFRSANDTQDSLETFLYPQRGNSSVWNRLGEQLESKGVIIHKGTRVNQIEVVNDEVTGLVVNDQSCAFDHIISTMPLGLLARLAVPTEARVNAAASVLRARSTVLVYLLAKATNHSEFNWLSVYPPDCRMGRITDFGHWMDVGDSDTIYCLEYWCDLGDELWSDSDENLIALAARELNHTKLFGDVSVKEGHVERLAGTHPVFSLGSQAAIETINDRLATIKGLSSVGRLGSHGVLGMGESMEAAAVVADRVIREFAEDPSHL